MYKEILTVVFVITPQYNIFNWGTASDYGVRN
jgi:hypothetical protein